MSAEALDRLTAEGIVAPENGGDKDESGKRRSQATELVALASDSFEFHTTPAGEPFAVPKSGPYVARMLRGGRDSLRAELSATYAETCDRAPSSQACADALNVLEGRALRGERVDLALRVARDGEGLVLDLGDDSGRAVVIEAGSWRIVARSPVLFRRTELTGALPLPATGGDLVAELRPFLNVDDVSAALLAGWLVAALIADIPHPIVGLTGEHGTAKSTISRTLTNTLDPSPVPLRKPPRDGESWVTAAAGSWMVGVDNLSNLQPWLSDSLCRAATGEGDVRRRLYSDGGLAVFSFRRCIVLNGIDLGALRGDLGDRLLPVEVERIEKEDRRPEEDMAAAWGEAHSRILGALLDVAAATMEARRSVRLEKLPRMADFARVLAAFDSVCGTETLGSYEGLAKHISEAVLEGDVVAQKVLAVVEGSPLVDGRHMWSGTAGELLAAVTDRDRKPPKGWPATGSAMAGSLRRAAPALRSKGMTVEYDGLKRSRMWTLTGEADPAGEQRDRDGAGAGGKTGATDRKGPLTRENERATSRATCAPLAPVVRRSGAQTGATEIPAVTRENEPEEGESATRASRTLAISGDDNGRARDKAIGLLQRELGAKVVGERDGTGAMRGTCGFCQHPSASLEDLGRLGLACEDCAARWRPEVEHWASWNGALPDEGATT